MVKSPSWLPNIEGYTNMCIMHTIWVSSERDGCVWCLIAAFYFFNYVEPLVLNAPNIHWKFEASKLESSVDPPHLKAACSAQQSHPECLAWLTWYSWSRLRTESCKGIIKKYVLTMNMTGYKSWPKYMRTVWSRLFGHVWRICWSLYQNKISDRVFFFLL